MSGDQVITQLQGARLRRRWTGICINYEDLMFILFYRNGLFLFYIYYS